MFGAEGDSVEEDLFWQLDGINFIGKRPNEGDMRTHLMVVSLIKLS